MKSRTLRYAAVLLMFTLAVALVSMLPFHVVKAEEAAGQVSYAGA